MKVLVIGAGDMGLTYAEGMSKSKLLKKKNIMMLDTSEEKLIELHQISHFDAYSDLEDCVPEADIIFIAIKPYHAENLFSWFIISCLEISLLFILNNRCEKLSLATLLIIKLM
jgi:pyrroline-5-carboxylate reductase